MCKDYSTKAQIIKEAKEWAGKWRLIAWLMLEYGISRQEAIDRMESLEADPEGPAHPGGEVFGPLETVLSIIYGEALTEEERHSLIRWKGTQECIERKKSKAQGGNLRAIWKAMEISDKWPDTVRIAIYNKLQKIYSHVPTTPRPEKSTTRQRTPRSHHRVAVSVRGGDSGDDDSGESDPPAPPLSRYGCPYLSVTCNPQPITIVSVDLLSRVPMADGHFAWTFGGV